MKNRVFATLLCLVLALVEMLIVMREDGRLKKYKSLGGKSKVW